ncbi:MAG: hypothetical protein AAFU79_10675 [Myxococcota bacterium]
MPTQQATTVFDLLPDLTAKKAFLLAQLLNRLADEIWRTYGADIGLLLAEQEGLIDDRRDLGSEEDLPF